MKQRYHVRPLCWVLLGLFAGIIVSWNIWSWQYVAASLELHVLFTTLLLIHLGIYWVGLSVEMRRSSHWLLLSIQAGLILLLTQLTQLVILALVLSPVLFVVATVLLKHIRSILLALAGYVILLLLYMNTVGPVRDWLALRSGGYAPEVALLGLFFLVVLMAYLHQEQRAHERTRALLQELDAAHIQLSAYALRVEELTMMTERQRIARDLHDTFVQGVVGLVMQLEVAQTQLQHQRIERAQEILEQVMEAARDTIADARCAIGNLRAASIRPDDLVEIVQEEINRFTATTEIPCQADLALLSATPAPLCEQVLRVITEGLTNVARHAQAHMVWVRTTHQDEMLTIEVCDDGVGFEPATISTQIGHYGLVGLRERAKLIGGKLEITSGAGTGTTLRICIPDCSPVGQVGGMIW
jgi:NarL family two-component system sensor histidine kinase YdfH